MKHKTLTLITLILIPVLFLNSNFKEKRQHVIISTEYGDIEIELYNETPKHRDNFIKLINDSLYRNLLFHRVINSFVIQGGDPDSKNAAPGKKLGQGGLNYTIPAEINPMFFHKKGALAAAREGDRTNPEKASSSTQFYIVHGKLFSEMELKFLEKKRNTEIYKKKFNELIQGKVSDTTNLAKKKKFHEEALAYVEENKFEFSSSQKRAYTKIGGAPSLDGNYTVFGEVVEGIEVVDKIANLHTDSNDRPYQDVRFTITLKK
jgi:cyclophilin family peptidyl-prolyl cis-trans isomerase